jgi:hypothetical protein
VRIDLRSKFTKNIESAKGRWIAAILFVALGAGSAAAQPSPDPHDRGIFVVPMKGSVTLATAGCTAFLMPFADPRRERGYPCGAWFLPPAGDYLIRVEYPGTISRTTGVVLVPAVVYPGGGKLTFSMVAAGRVTVGRETVWPKNGSLRMIGLDELVGFERRLDDPAKGLTGIQVPAGRMLFGLFDADGNAVALTRIMAIQAGRGASLDLLPPRTDGDVLAVFDGARGEDLRLAEVTLNSQTMSRPADATSRTPSHLVAVWYGVPAGAWRVGIDDGVNPATIVPLEAWHGAVVTLRKQLAPTASR